MTLQITARFNLFGYQTGEVDLTAISGLALIVLVVYLLVVTSL